MTTCLTHTEDYIKQFYLKIGITTPQELQFQTISKRLGINNLFWAEASQALLTGGQRIILLNENLSPQQQWQEYCHELPHLLLHTGRQRKLPKLFVEYQEYKANQFMYHAAVPTFMLDNLQLYDSTNQNVFLIQQLFNVEEQFAFTRLTRYLNRKRDMPNWNTYLYGS